MFSLPIHDLVQNQAIPETPSLDTMRLDLLHLINVSLPQIRVDNDGDVLLTAKNEIPKQQRKNVPFVKHRDTALFLRAPCEMCRSSASILQGLGKAVGVV